MKKICGMLVVRLICLYLLRYGYDQVSSCTSFSSATDEDETCPTAIKLEHEAGGLKESKNSSAYSAADDDDDGAFLLSAIDLMGVPGMELDGSECLRLTLLLHAQYERSCRFSDPSSLLLSPHETIPAAERQGGPRTLFFVEWWYIDAVMDRHLFHTYCGAFAADGKRGDRVIMWGPGWPGWNASITVEENIKKRWREPFSLVIAKDDPDDINLSGAVYMTYRYECVLNEKPYHDSSRWNCVWGPHKKWPWRLFQIILLAYENDFQALFHHLADPETKLVRQYPDTLISLFPQTVLPGTFYRMLKQHQRSKRRFEERPYDFCLMGRVDRYWYPVRTKVNDWITDGTFAKYGLVAHVLPHFGYTEVLPEAERRRFGISATVLEQQYERYIDFLFQCKVALVSRSIRDYDLRKYVEVAMSGALLMGNVPTSPTPHAIWSKFVVDVHDVIMEERAPELARIIAWWLSKEQDKIRSRKIYEAGLYAYSRSTAQHGWQRMQENYLAYISDRRGFMVSSWYRNV